MPLLPRNPFYKTECLRDMAAKESFAEGEATIYDKEGRTRIPNDVRDNLGWEEGDKVKMVVMNGHLYVTRVGDEE